MTRVLDFARSDEAPSHPRLLEVLSAALEAAKAGDLPGVLGRIGEAQGLVLLALMQAPQRSEAPAEDHNLSAKEAARRLGVSLPYLYKHANEYPFTRRIGERVLFSARGLEVWNAGQRPCLTSARLDG